MTRVPGSDRRTRVKSAKAREQGLEYQGQTGEPRSKVQRPESKGWSARVRVPGPEYQGQCTRVSVRVPRPEYQDKSIRIRV